MILENLRVWIDEAGQRRGKSFLCRRNCTPTAPFLNGQVSMTLGPRDVLRISGSDHSTGKSARISRNTVRPPIAAAMVRVELSRSIWAAAEGLLSVSRPQCTRMVRYPPRTIIRPAPRFISTTQARRADLVNETNEPAPEPFSAAPELEFEEDGEGGEDGDGSIQGQQNETDQKLLRTLRVVPASPSYFSAKPTFTDDFINLSALLRSVATLPTIPNSEAPRVAWKTVFQYRIMTNEPVKTARYHRMLHILKRLNCVHPSLMPEHVRTAMRRYMKDSQPGDIVPTPGVIDEWGRAKGVGRRKTSSAVAWLVEGEGEALVNGKSLSQYFGRLHHRESAVWALKATQRLDKYNIFGLVQGGGSTGQAEALTLAVAKALLVHEPALKPALRRGRCCVHSVGHSHLLTWYSWYDHPRSEEGGKEEDWSRQGSEDAHLGQALSCLPTVLRPCILAYVLVVTYSNLGRLTYGRHPSPKCRSFCRFATTVFLITFRFFTCPAFFSLDQNHLPFSPSAMIPCGNDLGPEP